MGAQVTGMPRSRPPMPPWALAFGISVIGFMAYAAGLLVSLALL
jgi:hypothetical protein